MAQLSQEKIYTSDTLKTIIWKHYKKIFKRYLNNLKLVKEKINAHNMKHAWVGRHWINPIIQNLEFKYPEMDFKLQWILWNILYIKFVIF